MLKLTYSNLEFQNFPGKDPGRGGKGKGGEEREGKGKGRRERKDTEWRGGTGRDRGGRKEGGEEWRVVGGEERGGALDMGSAPLQTSSGSAPELTALQRLDSSGELCNTMTT